MPSSTPKHPLAPGTQGLPGQSAYLIGYVEHILQHDGGENVETGRNGRAQRDSCGDYDLRAEPICDTV